MIGLAVVAALVSALPEAALIRSPGVRQLALRPLARRPGQATLVVCGVLIATASLTSSAVVGDGLRASIARGATSQLGPVDEEVVSAGGAAAIEAAIAAAPLRDVETLPLLVQPATAIGQDFVPRVAPAQVIEVDFSRAAAFGGRPSETGIGGPTPTGATAVIGSDLAADLDVTVGHRVAVSAYGLSRTFRIVRVLPRRGLAGLAPIADDGSSESPNLFVPLGTIAAMRRQSAAASVGSGPAALTVVAVANRAARPGAPGPSTVLARLQSATARLGVAVRPVKQDLLARAQTAGARFTALFRAFGFFVAVGGFLLLVLTFGALIRDRRIATAVLRATGLTRASLVAALTAEGGVYAVIGVLLGAAAGIGVARLVLLAAAEVFAGPDAGRLELVPSVPTASVASAMLAGLVASLAVVGVLAGFGARRSIGASLRGAPPRRRPPASSVLRLVGAVLVLAGIGLTSWGAAADQAVGLIAGPLVGGVGVVTGWYPTGRVRLVVSVVSIAALGWAVGAPSVFPAAFGRVDPGVVGSEGVALTISVVALVVVNYRGVGARRPAGARRRWMALRLGGGYVQSEPARTALVVAMVATAVFSVALAVTIGHIEGHDTGREAAQLGGGAALLVTSDPTNPVPAGDVAALDGVRHVAATAAIAAQVVAIDGTPSGPGTSVTLVAVNGSLIGHGTPPLASSPPLPAGPLYRRIADDPTQVVVGADFGADPTSGLVATRPGIGARIGLRDPVTGATRTVTVAAVAQQAQYGGTDHLYGAASLLRRLGGVAPPANLLYVDTAGVDNDVVAAIVDGTHLPNGTSARSFARLAREKLGPEQQFLAILGGYAAMALVADLVGLAVVMTDRVHARRRDMAMLRAIGVRSRTITGAFGVEAAAIVLQGWAIGVAASLLLAWRLVSGPVLAGEAFSLAAVPLLEIGVLLLVSALGCVLVTTRRSGRSHPGPHLRRDE